MIADAKDLISVPGVYEMPAERYHSDPVIEPSLSSSLAKLLLTRSPKHAWTEHPRLNPNYKPIHKAAFDLGSGAHAMLLEGADRMEVVYADNWTTKAAKELRDNARARGRHPVLARVYENILKMNEQALRTIANCEDFGGITLADGKTEQTLIWKKGTAWFRCRPDFMTNSRRVFFDYKTTDASASPTDWVRTMVGLGGEIQGGFYLWGNEETGGPREAKFIFLVQEIYPPFACVPIGLSPSFVELGRNKVAVASEYWTRSMETKEFPSYPPRIAWVDPPPWHEARWYEKESALVDIEEQHVPEERDGAPQEGDLIFPET